MRRFGGRDGTELAYREVGSGRTLILLPGFSATRLVVSPGFTTTQNVPARLEAPHSGRVIAGYGFGMYWRFGPLLAGYAWDFGWAWPDNLAGTAAPNVFLRHFWSRLSLTFAFELVPRYP